MTNESSHLLASHATKQRAARYWFRRYAVLTVALCVPLVWAFGTLRQVYPVAAWAVMVDSRALQHGRTYFILRGETISGETLDIPATHLTNAMSARAWSMTSATEQNASLFLDSPHPDNVRLLALVGGSERLPRGARMPDLLRAWGEIYNARQPVTSPHRLRVIRLDVYRWEGGDYTHYDRFLETWRVEL